MSTEGLFIIVLGIVDLVLVWWKLHTDGAHEREIAKINREHTAALIRIGQAVEALSGGQGQPTENEIDVNWRRSDERLVITNVGAGPVDLIDVNVQEDPTLLVEPKLPPNPLNLAPGRSHEILAPTHFGMQQFMTVVITWSDESGIHQTEHQVTLR